MSVQIVINITREDIIQMVQDKAKARGLDVSPERIQAHPDLGGFDAGIQYGIQVQTIFDGFPVEAEETTLADLKCYFCPVSGLSVTMRPLEVKASQPCEDCGHPVAYCEEHNVWEHIKGETCFLDGPACDPRFESEAKEDGAKKGGN